MWLAEFKRRRQSLEDCAGPVRPVTVATQEIINRIHGVIMADRRVTERYILSVNENLPVSPIH